MTEDIESENEHLQKLNIFNIYFRVISEFVSEQTV